MYNLIILYIQLKVFDSDHSSESTSPSELPRRTLRSLSMMICIPKNFVPNIKPKRNTMNMSPLKLRDPNPEEGYNSDENKEKLSCKLHRRKHALYTVFTSTSSKKGDHLVDDLLSSTVSKLCNQYPIAKRNKKKNRSILTLLQKRK